MADGPKPEKGRPNGTSLTFHKTQLISLCTFTLLSNLLSTHFASSLGHKKTRYQRWRGGNNCGTDLFNDSTFTERSLALYEPTAECGIETFTNAAKY